MYKPLHTSLKHCVKKLWVWFLISENPFQFDQKLCKIWDKQSKKWRIWSQYWQQSRNPVCHQGFGAPLGTAARSWSLQHLNGVLCLSPCLFSLLSCIHLIGKIFSWQPHLVGELWEHCQPVHSSIPVESKRASYPNCLSLNLSLCLSTTGNHHLLNHLEPH